MILIYLLSFAFLVNTKPLFINGVLKLVKRTVKVNECIDKISDSTLLVVTEGVKPFFIKRIHRHSLLMVHFYLNISFIPIGMKEIK